MEEEGKAGEITAISERYLDGHVESVLNVRCISASAADPEY